MKNFLLVAIVIGIVGFKFLFSTPVQATFVPDAVCGKGVHVGNPHCVKPTPTPCIKVSPSPSATPSVEVTPEFTESPTASPTAEVTVVPTVVPQSDHGDGLSDGHESGKPNANSVPKAPPKTGRAL